MKGILIGVLVVAVLGIAAFLFVNSSKDENSNSSNSTNSTTNSEDSTQTSTDDSSSQEAATTSVTITYSSSGFSPASARLAKGGTITWVNNDSSQLQVGVDPHPSHSGNKAITDGQFVIALGSGESKTVTANETGTFGFHNHLDASDTGMVIVE